MPRSGQTNGARSGLFFVLLFGAVNLFADMTYEGARSVTGPFFGMLGASGFIVGAVTGFGEFLGYARSLVSGRWADRSHLYWPITLGGYIVQMVSVPALALSGSWPVAAVLILLERVGRATRNPPRDVMLAQAGEQMGRGWAFGVNEAMDQCGAMIGPLAIAALLAWKGDFQLAFASLALPAVVTFLLVFGARVAYPDAGRIEREPETSQVGRYPPTYWWYCLRAGLVGFGFADYLLIAFHLSRTQVVSDHWIALFYALAMGAGGLGSLIIGKLFDQVGLLVLLPVTVLVAVYAPLAFFGGFTLSLIGALLFGLGAHESVMQAAVAQMVPRERLGSAYGGLWSSLRRRLVRGQRGTWRSLRRLNCSRSGACSHRATAGGSAHSNAARGIRSH
jgi:MFS family permease